MKKNVQLKKVNQPQEFVVLNTEHGTFSPKLLSSKTGIDGCYISIHGQQFGIFASDSNLYFQWNNKRWNLRSLGSKIRYEHDFQRQTTSFSVDDEIIRYPAWWVGDATFEPSLPERDEDEDFLAYVTNVSRNDVLQDVLVKSWDN